MSGSAQSARRVRRLLPQTLAGQLVALLLLAVFATQILSLWIFHDARQMAMISVARDNIVVRAVSIAKLLDDTPKEIHRRILRASGSRFAAFQTDAAPVVTEPETLPVERRLQRQLSRGFDDGREVRIDVDSRDAPNRQRTDRQLSDREAGRDQGEARDRGNPRGPFPRPPRRIENLAISIAMPDGSWLNVTTRYRPPPGALVPLLTQLGLTVLAILIVIWFAVRRATRPLNDLAVAADKLGRGEEIPLLDVRGPKEVRAVTTAFNDMQDRLTRFVRDRTRMLAAISHDLRTPITSLRLRAEFIEDEENRDRIIETLDEMAAMTAAALSFARNEAHAEPSDPTNLTALLTALAGDQQDMGHDVDVTSSERIVLTCKPVALKRAFRNLIENGVRYGEAVTVSIEDTGSNVVVRIKDKGPGIPEDQLADVFEPFVRLEESRSEETGGIGLGLAITRSIIHAHGGTITLKNRPTGGLEAEVRLPSGA